MKTNSIIRIILWSILLVILLGVMSAFLYRDQVSTRTWAATVTAPTEAIETPMNTAGDRVTLNASEIRDIDIQWVAGGIRIQRADVDGIILSESAPRDPEDAMLWKTRGGELSIRFSQRENSLIGIHNELSKDLTILVPRDWECDELEIETASADLEISDLAIKALDFDGASGNCLFRNCTVETLDMDTASGDVEFYGSLNILDCDAASANITAVLQNHPTLLEMDSMSGDLDVTLPESCGFSLTMDGLSTSLTSEFPLTRHNGADVYGDGACRITLDAMSGSVTLHRATEESPQ